jgi:acetyl esterase
MPLDPILVPLVEGLRGDLPDVPVQTQRAQGLANGAAQVGTVIEPAPADVHITTLWVPGPHDAPPVKVKAYRTPGAGRSRAGLLYIHGGGWTLGAADSPDSDAHCAHLAKGAEVVVVSVEYRLAPEHRFPAGLDDCYAALEWVASNADLLGIDPARLAVGGGSAGGNLSAALTLRARDEAGPAIALQLLEAPALDLTMGSPSAHAFDAEFPAIGQMAARTPRDYLNNDAERTHPWVSPLLADSLAGLPRAVILTCEIDPVRDDGARYAERLRAAGVAVEHTLYEGLLHGTSSLTLLLPGARAWRDQCVAALRTL